MLGTCQFDTGGAHPNTDVVGLNYAIKGGVAKKIALTDIMVVRTDPVEFATEFVLPKLEAMGVASVESGETYRLDQGAGGQLRDDARRGRLGVRPGRDRALRPTARSSPS